MRYLYDEINWDNRLILIRGPKGSGKTTMIMQHIQRMFPDKSKVLYCSVDHLWFASHSLLDLAQYAYTHDISHLFFDEIHKYRNWSQEIKNIYDSYPKLHVVITGSNALEITRQKYDLSRRCRVYTMQGLSFREYLKLEGVADLPVLSLEDIVTNHINLSVNITIAKNIKVLLYFERYIKEGYYPFYRDETTNYSDRLSQVIDTIIFNEIPAVSNLEFDSVYKVKPLLAILAQQNPYTLNISSLGKTLNASRNVLLKLLDLLDQAALIRRLYAESDGWAQINKPEKILFDNTNLMYALSPNAEIGTMRETFCASMLAKGHLIAMPQKGDLLVDKHLLFEVGGRTKGYKQIANIPDSYIVADGITMGIENKIPMWLFGFLY
ncbi:MAG: ATP-binding protein [Paludibacteraceae bacterium]|nr:ATP-binding protein [Paludibacteraceae bacterium]